MVCTLCQLSSIRRVSIRSTLSNRTRPGVRAFGRVNGGLAFQGFQTIAGNAVPLCHVLYADKAGSTKNCSHHPIYGKFHLQILFTYAT
jgi:hypothetical protein